MSDSVVVAERAAIHEAHSVLTDRRNHRHNRAVADLPLQTATITHPRDVFADPETVKAAEEIGKLGRHLRVSMLLEPHGGEVPASLADFGYSAPLRAMLVSADG